MKKKPEISKEEFNRIEQRTLTISLYGVFVGMLANLLYGIYIAADIVILNGVFALLTLMGAAMSLLTAKLVVRPADEKFQYGYWHFEPLVQCFNGLMMALICIYAFINGIEGIRSGGHEVNANHVIWFSIAGTVYCSGMWAYKFAVSQKIDSALIHTDTTKWIIKLAFHIAALVGFTMLNALDEPYRTEWSAYIDSGLVAIMALLLTPLPYNILKRNIRAILHMVSTDDEMVERVNTALEKIKSEPGIRDYSSHVVEVGRIHMVEIHMLVDGNFKFQTIAEQDSLREMLWKAIDKPAEDVKFALYITTNPQWANQLVEA